MGGRLEAHFDRTAAAIQPVVEAHAAPRHAADAEAEEVPAAEARRAEADGDAAAPAPGPLDRADGEPLVALQVATIR